MEDPLCPLGTDGREVSISCSFQAVLVIIFLGVLPLTFCCYCVWRMKEVTPQQLRSKEAAKTDSGGGGMRSTSTAPQLKRASSNESDAAAVPSVQLVSRRSSSNMDCEEGRDGSTAALPSLERVASDETASDKTPGVPASKSRFSITSGWSLHNAVTKIHVVWDVNIRQAQEWLAGKKAKMAMPAWTKKKIRCSDDPDLEFSDLFRQGRAPETATPDESVQDEEKVAAVPEEGAVPKLPTKAFCPAYLRGERVEYYSTTHLVWLLAEVSNMTIYRMDMFYSVRLHRSAQERHHCELEALRSPLLAGDPCDFWCMETQHWLPAMITNTEAGNSAIRHCNVEIIATLKTVRVQASFLRPRFPVGSPVVVYKNITQGWVLANVVDEHQAIAQQSTAARDPLAAPPGKLEMARGMLPAQKIDGSMLDYAVMVPVEEGDTGNETSSICRNETESSEPAEPFRGPAEHSVCVDTGQTSIIRDGSKQLELVHSSLVRHRRPGEDWWNLGDSVSL